MQHHTTLCSDDEATSETDAGASACVTTRHTPSTGEVTVSQRGGVDLRRPHYKKDSRFVGSLYTLAYGPDALAAGTDDQDGRQSPAHHQHRPLHPLHQHHQQQQLRYLNLECGVGTMSCTSRDAVMSSVVLDDDVTNENDGYVEDDELWRSTVSSLLQRGPPMPSHQTANDSTVDEQSLMYQSLPANVGAITPSLTEHEFTSQGCLSASEAAQLRLARRQLQLQEDARLALAQAGRMARWQSELDRQNGGRITAQVVARVIFGSTLRESNPPPVNRTLLQQLSVSQLKRLLAELQTKISELNGSLLQLLEERDQQLQLQDERLAAAELAISCNPPSSVTPAQQLLQAARTAAQGPLSRRHTHTHRQKSVPGKIWQCANVDAR